MFPYSETFPFRKADDLVSGQESSVTYYDARNSLFCRRQFKKLFDAFY